MKEKGLTNKQIADLIATDVYNPSMTETEFAFQLFVERMVCPPNCDAYSDDEMKTWILQKLEE
jgi:hypothetical protein